MHNAFRMDKSESGTIDLIEFKDFMLLYPSTDPRDIAEFWRHNLVSHSRDFHYF